MNLEDHFGDIIRKARTMSNVSAKAAAKAAGLTEPELSALEESGATSKPVNYPALAGLIGLNPAKLESIARGWLPAQKDLSRWRELRVFTTSAEGITVNCYLAWDAATREAALFDTGWEAKPILDCLAQNQLQLRHIFVTHSHHDHVAALAPIRDAFPQAQIHSSSSRAPASQRNQPGDCTQLGQLRITFRETPGHAEDGVTYVLTDWPASAPAVAMVGDAIFAGSMGRGNQSWELARRKVREEILTLPPETLLCPGHGPLTTVAEEISYNPFF